MLASELATQLRIDPSAMTRRLSLYYAESGRQRQRNLDEKTVEAMTEIQRLLESNEAKTAREAVQMLLGKYRAPIPASSVQEVLRRLSAIEATQSSILEQVAAISNYVASRQRPTHPTSQELMSALDQLPDNQG